MGNKEWDKKYLALFTILIFIGVYLFPFGQDLAFFAVKDTIGQGSDEITWFWMYVITSALIFTGVIGLILKGKKPAQMERANKSYKKLRRKMR